MLFNASQSNDIFCRDALKSYVHNINKAKEMFDEAKLCQARAKVEELIADIAASNMTDLTPTSDTTHKIELTNETPFNIKTRPVPYAKKEEFKKMIDEMLAANLIKRSKSSYTSPVRLVKKPD